MRRSSGVLSGSAIRFARLPVPIRRLRWLKGLRTAGVALICAAVWGGAGCAVAGAKVFNWATRSALTDSLSNALNRGEHASVRTDAGFVYVLGGNTGQGYLSSDVYTAKDGLGAWAYAGLGILLSLAIGLIGTLVGSAAEVRRQEALR